MMIEINNNLKLEVEVGASDTLDPTRSNFNFKKIPQNKPAKIDRSKRFVAINIKSGEGFQIKPTSRILFDFVQVIPQNPKHPGNDSYVFQVTKMDSFQTLSGGDADIEPPNPDQPINGEG